MIARHVQISHRQVIIVLVNSVAIGGACGRLTRRLAARFSPAKAKDGE